MVLIIIIVADLKLSGFSKALISWSRGLVPTEQTCTAKYGLFVPMLDQPVSSSLGFQALIMHSFGAKVCHAVGSSEYSGPATLWRGRCGDAVSMHGALHVLLQIIQLN